MSLRLPLANFLSVPHTRICSRNVYLKQQKIPNSNTVAQRVTGKEYGYEVEEMQNKRMMWKKREKKLGIQECWLKLGSEGKERTK